VSKSGLVDEASMAGRSTYVLGLVRAEGTTTRGRRRWQFPKQFVATREIFVLLNDTDIEGSEYARNYNISTWDRLEHL